MKTSLKIHLAILAAGSAFLSIHAAGAKPAAEPVRVTENFDAGWKFFKGDAAGAEGSGFDDRSWRTVNLPHDWSIEGPFAQTNKAGGAGAFLPGGVAWYRKEFSLPETFVNKRVFIEFDGVMANSDVWINGFHLCHRPNGYVSFGYQLTGTVLNFGTGAVNVIAVRSDTSAQPASRWYAGAGIYRHVRLVIVNPVHFVQNGTFVYTSKTPDGLTMVHLDCLLTNQSDAPRFVLVRTRLIAPDGKVSGEGTCGLTVKNGTNAPSETKSSQLVILAKPQLWDLDNPKMYRAVTRIYYSPPQAGLPVAPEELLDEETNSFGIRDARFEAATGFWLNGKNFKIKGVCLHADGGAFGAAVPLDVWRERLQTLKKLGVNAIRTAHNPPAPELLDLCDQMGFLVMDEFFDCWTVGKNPYDYHLYFDEWSRTDERDTIMRDRNHPCVILYSVGNEIHDTPKADLAKGILKGLVEVAHETDPTRPVTQALFRPNASGDYTNGLADLLDVIGTNYRDNELQAAQRAKPSRKIIGTEQRHDRQTWLWLRDSPSEAGQFLWTGVDYLGESRRWPIVAAGSGLLDRTGAPKPMAYERASWWLAEPTVSIARRTDATANAPTDPGFAPLDRRQVLFADWTPKDPGPHNEDVEVYSNCKEVELFLNGKSLGVKTINADASPRNWIVPFAPGILKAVARNEKGKVVATDELRTAGQPTKIQLTRNLEKIADDWNGVACVRAAVVDQNGIRVPSANNRISFKISGPGVVAAVDSADNASHEPFQTRERLAYQGECVAFVKATAPAGEITLTASAPGLKSSSVKFKALRPVSPE